jgi:hypothetical protein
MRRKKGKKIFFKNNPRVIMKRSKKLLLIMKNFKEPETIEVIPGRK